MNKETQNHYIKKGLQAIGILRKLPAKMRSKYYLAKVMRISRPTLDLYLKAVPEEYKKVKDEEIKRMNDYLKSMSELNARYE